MGGACFRGNILFVIIAFSMVTVAICVCLFSFIPVLCGVWGLFVCLFITYL